MGVALGVAILVATLSARTQDVHTFSIAYKILAIISAMSAVFALQLRRPGVQVSAALPSEREIANLPS
jgi:hypothetical protein